MRQEVIAPTEKRIECQEGRFHRLLARATSRGIWLWCKEHGRAHLVTWEELALLHEEFRPMLVQRELRPVQQRAEAL
jgi:hypothetical protein